MTATALQTTQQMPLSKERAQRIRKYVRSSKAGGTQRVYAARWADFQEWCAWRGYASLSAAPQAVCDYLAELADAGKSVSTLNVAMAAIGFMHQAAKAGNPCDSAEVKTVMAGIRRTVGVRPTRKAPITLPELRKLLEGIEDDLRGQRDRAMLLVGYAGAFRRSELVAVTVADLTFFEDRLSILLPRSKTDQEGAGKTKVMPRLDSDLCPVAAIEAWIAAAGITSGRVFRGIDRHGHVHDSLNDREVARMIKRRAVAAGLDPKRLAGHSLRAGFVTQNALAGTPDWKIAEQTGHKPGSKVLHDYIRAAGRGAMDASRAAFGG
jgi:integrase